MTKAPKILIAILLLLLTAPGLAQSTESPVRSRFSTEIESIQKALLRIDSALYQLDSDGANASTRYAVEQLLGAKAELLKTKTALSKVE